VTDTDDLKAIRNHLGLSVEAMAREMGMSKAGYHNLEQGKAEVKKIHLAQAYMVALDMALFLENPMLVPAPLRKKALELARLITDG